MSVIKDLWEGNICAMQDCCRDTTFDHTDFEIYEQLKQILTTDEQRRLLESYVDTIHEVAEDWQQQAFEYGFRLGHSLALETK